MDAEPAAEGTRSRRRGAALEDAILDAAAALLAEGGYAALTMDAVARRAGTNKNAVYRRWPHRAALGVAAYRRRAAAGSEPPDTGELRGDVLEYLRRANRTWSSPSGAILRGLLAGARDDPGLLDQIQRAAGDGGAEAWTAVLRRAVARGEAPPGALHPRVATAAVVLLRNEYVTRGVPRVPDEVLVEIVDEVFLPLVRGRGAAPG